ncbi:MAG TPA: helix-turn-helix transcriptional regulator [Streptosporangiaceae bacterium]|nr:helix-turn-helix transcriptional regulator [Streptosporangiaceae bacterium]
MTDFGGELRRLMAERGISLRETARRVPCDSGYLSKVASGTRRPSGELAGRLDDLLGAGGELAAFAPSVTLPGADDEIAAVELARRAAASDVGDAAVSQLEASADDMALAYPRTPPAQLLGRVRAHLGYVTGLLAGRMTLAEHRRLLITTGWLSLLAATCLIDLRRFPAASAHLRTAAQLAGETGHAEIAAWCLETRAWQLLTDGDYRRAADLAQAAQRAAPREGSAFIQATGQEARAWARLGATRECRDALARTEALVGPLPVPDRPEHHYRYDPAKADAYTATTLAWLGDPAAARYARDVLGRLEAGGQGPPRPRRAASARLDLSLALTASGDLGEAAATALAAVTSGLLVPSNYWRAGEVISVIGARGLPGAGELREAYREYCRAALPPPRPGLP